MKCAPHKTPIENVRGGGNRALENSSSVSSEHIARDHSYYHHHHLLGTLKVGGVPDAASLLAHKTFLQKQK